MKNIISLFLLMCASLAQAQVINWSYSYNGSANVNDEGSMGAPSLDGRVYVCGQQNELMNSGTDGIFISLDPDGDTNWTYHYNGAADSIDMFTSFTQGPDSMLYVLGSTMTSSNNYDVLVVKLNRDGIVQWTYTYNDADNGRDEGSYSIIVGPDGNLYCSARLGNASGNGDFGMLSLTTAGVHRGVYQYNGTANQDDDCFRLFAGPDNTIYGSGMTNGLTSGEDFTIISIDLQLNERWRYIYNGTGNGSDMAYFQIEFDAIGNLYCTGHTKMAVNEIDLMMVSLRQSNGSQRWLSTYNGPGNGDDIGHFLQLVGDTCIYVSGVSYGAGNNYDVVVLKYDTAGQQEWVYRYNGTMNLDDNALILDYGPDNNIYVSGMANNLNNTRDWYIACVSNTGMQKWAIEYSGTGNDQDEGRPLFCAPDGSIYTSGFTTNGNGRDLTVIKLCNMPSPSFTADADTICLGSTVNFTNTSVDGIACQWKDNGSPFASTLNASRTFVTPGLHAISLLVMSGECVDSVTVNVFVRNLPNADAGNDTTKCYYHSILLNASGGVSYSWTPAAGLSSTAIPNPVCSSPNSISYTVTVTDAFGCVNVDSLTVISDVVSCPVSSPEISMAAGHSIYPNPFHNMAILEFEPAGEARELIIYDATGRIVRIIPVQDGAHKVELERGGLSEGLYYFNMFSGESLLLKGKFTIE